MQGMETTAPRNAQISVLERNRANETLKPFVGDLKAWNVKAAHLHGRVASVYSSEEDRSLARLECGALVAEIRHRHNDLRAAIKGEPPHGRFDDVVAAFEQLIGRLEEISDSHRKDV